MSATKYSIVVPVYNEQESIPDLVKQLRQVMDLLDGPAEALPIDDGSRDAGYQLMLAASSEDPRFKVLQLSRNFGHQIAITAGMDAAAGEAVVIMDADLQDPPEMVFGYLELAVIMAIWLAGPSKVPSVRSVRSVRLVRGMRWLLALLAVVVIAANFPHLVLRGRPGLFAFVASGAYRHDLTAGSTIVVVSTRRGNAGLLFEAETGFYTRLAGGYVNRAITHSDLLPPVADLATGKLTTREIQQFRSFIRTAGVSAILVEAHSRRRWRVIFARLGLKRHAIQGGMLYRTS